MTGTIRSVQVVLLTEDDMIGSNFLDIAGLVKSLFLPLQSVIGHTILLGRLLREDPAVLWCIEKSNAPPMDCTDRAE